MTLGDVYFVPSVVDSGRGRLQKYGTSPSGPEAYLIYTALMDCEVDVHYSRNEVYQTGNPTPVKFDTRIVLSSADEDVFRASPAMDSILHGQGKDERRETHSCSQWPANPRKGTPRRCQSIATGSRSRTTRQTTYRSQGRSTHPRNLGFDTQFDFVKGFVQRYGLFVDADRVEKKFYIHGTETV